MKLKSLTDKELKEEIIWHKVKVMTLEFEKSYENQSYEERITEYHDAHKIYSKYWDEAVRRKMVQH